MKIAFLGTRLLIDKEKALIQRNFDTIDIVPLIYERYTDCVDILGERQDEFDGVLFPGPLSINYAEKHLKPTCPWGYIAYDPDCILATFLQVSCKYGYDITMSVDTADEDMVKPIFDIVDLPPDSFKCIYLPKNRMTDDDYFKSTVHSHMYNYYSGAVKLCLTGFSEIAMELQKRNIPHIRFQPTERALCASVSRLHERMTPVESASDTAVIILEADTKGTSGSGDICDTLQREYEAASIIKSLALRLDSDLIHCSDGRFMIYCNKDVLNAETDNFSAVYFNQLTMRHTQIEIRLGIGLGDTIKHANSNAHLAFSKAGTSRESIGYVAYDAQNIMGPLKIRQKVITDTSRPAGFTSVLMNMGFGQENARRMALVIESSETKCFTVKELSNKTGISTRAVARVVQSLEDAGYCHTIGTRVGASAGRPARVLQFEV